MGTPVTTVDPNGTYVGPGTAGGGPGTAQVGSLTETAPATDTASSGLNGRLQRIAQRLTSWINGATNTSRILSAAASTNATSAKASAGSVHGISGYNAAAAGRYLKFYDKASAPTVGTDTPRKTVYLPATTAFAISMRDYYATGIAYALTTGVADNDTGALTAADILGLNIDYA